MSEPKQLKAFFADFLYPCASSEKNSTISVGSFCTSLGSLLVKGDPQSLSTVIILLCQLQKQAETCFVVFKINLKAKSCFLEA